METPFDEPRHPIGVAEERTGLSADVIRAWERRYGAVEPARDGSGQRRYSDADVERLRQLRRATEAGRRISEVARLGRDALGSLVSGDEAARRAASGSGERGASRDRVEELESAALGLDGEALESGLRRALLELGFFQFAEEVAAPLLRRLGDGWHAGTVTVAQEHLATVSLRRVLEAVWSGGLEEGGTGPSLVVATLEGDRHEAGALIVAAVASLAGRRTVYLGADVPVPEAVSAAASTGATAVCVSATYRGGRLGPTGLLRRLRSALPAAVDVYAGGPATEEIREDLEGAGIRCPPDLASLRAALDQSASGG
jgi:DNA-binding transcriptional MerR regulator/methylmalonyl-CoA mutase cobalamin-binding subunit